MSYSHIDTNTLTMIKAGLQLTSAYVKALLGTGNPELCAAADLLAAGFVPHNLPPLTETQVYTGETLIFADRTEAEVRDKTAEEISTETAQAIADNCVAIDDAARDYAEHRLQPVGMVLVDRMMRYPTPNAKAQAVDTWMQSLYVESEYRKALCLAGLGPMDGSELDFSSFGEKPYTVAQLMAEYTGL